MPNITPQISTATRPGNVAPIAESADAVFQGYFRCPPEFCAFKAEGQLSGEQEFFTFGGVTCYGRRQLPVEPTRRASDVTDAVPLPFNLSEVVNNLRQERYPQSAGHAVERVTAAAAVRNAYYFLRPILPVSVRKHLQKVRLSGWDKVAFPHWPIDFSVDALMQEALALQLHRLGADKIPFVWFWPDGVPSSAILTHDVETKAGRNFCGELMDIDDEYGIKASFQLVPEKRYAASQALGERIRSRGFEVNVHDLNHDGRLFHTHSQFLDRAARINQYARERGSHGFRSAAMYREQAWFDALEFAYDMSVPNVAHLEPQRGGCCTVMPYFIGEILELPLTTIQDYSLFHILHDYSTALWKTQIDLLVAANGLVTLLTHPDYLIDHRAQAVYRELLRYVGSLRDERSLWIALPGEVERWWRSRSRMDVVRAGRGWTVTGPDCERARIAYASVQNGYLIYEVDGRIMRETELSCV